MGKAGGTATTQKQRRGKSPLTGAVTPDPKGKAGRSGRPSYGWLDFTAGLRGDVAVQRAIRVAASDPESRGFKAAIDLLAKYDPELPGRKVQLDAHVTVQGVIALPVMQIPQPLPTDRVLDSAEDATVAVNAPSTGSPLTTARADLLARLTGPR